MSYKKYVMPQSLKRYFAKDSLFRDYRVKEINILDILNDNNLFDPVELSFIAERRPHIWGDNTNDYKIDPLHLNVNYNDPIRLEYKNGKYRILDGYHRIIALFNSGYDTAEVLVKDKSQIKEDYFKDYRDNIVDQVRSMLGVSNTPVVGPSYILKDGKFLKIWDADLDIKGMSGSGSKSGKAMHLDVDGLIYKHIDPDKYAHFYLNKDCIRVNTGFEEYIVLSQDKPTRAQWESLATWLDFYFFDQKHDKLTVMDYYGSWANSKTYYLDKITPEDILKKIKRYYATGELVENKARFRVE